ncbi:Transposon Tf2-6 polyprotein [Araneus ventricosus]|uniref:RNA-directed DNA polymerase n=1 Tax=Araneus ventricosus TaxID=182803 RepID=A0A4Y2QXP0_ARAVE|nr:Transposon Tf2-6 polyprotein [Araneus ventricosus]
MTDRMHEYNLREVAAVKASKPEYCTSELKEMKLQISELSKRVETLNARFPSLNAKKRHRSRSESRERNNRLCFYHYKFGDRAHKCIKPCSFQNNGVKPSEISVTSETLVYGRRLYVQDRITKTQFLVDTDDILVFSKDKTEHTQHLEQIFKRFVDFGITINESKCEFGKPQVDFLGHTINSEDLLPMTTKVKAIQEFPKPETVSQLRSFLGMVNFYHRFIPKSAEILAPLNAYLVGSKKRDKTRIKWIPETDASFDKIKKCLADATLLSHPSTDAKLALVTDCSDFAMRGVLSEITPKGPKPFRIFFQKS